MSELLNEISSKELTEWMAFYSLEPFGTEVDLLGHAIVASLIYNANRGKNRAKSPAEFIPDFESALHKQSVDEMKDIARIMTEAYRNNDELA